MPRSARPGVERRGIGSIAILTLGLLAGCAAPIDTAAVTAPAELLAPGIDSALFDDPQHFPHPAYGWPTLTHVPADAPAWWQPISARAMPAPIAGLDHLSRVDLEANAADGFAVFGRLLVMPGHGGTTEIVDITDPAAPIVLSSFEPQMAARSTNLVPYPDGRLVAVLVADAPFLQLYDITDPTAPEELAIIELPSGAHNVGVVPGTPILYNANSVGTLLNPLFLLFGGTSIPQVEIYDLSDPTAPVLVQEWQNGLGCHAISFHLATPEKLRAYCPGLDRVQIWDIADPLAPVVVADFPFTHAQEPLPGNQGLTSVAHTAIVDRDATTLAVTDETLGGGGPYCDANLEAGGRSVSGPLGNVWFYDITDEAEPKLAGWISVSSPLVDDPAGWCLAHVGRMVPDADRDIAAVAFYAGGIALIDFTDATAPLLLDQWKTPGGLARNSEPSDVWYHQGYLFAGDQRRGLDVLTFR